MATIAIFGATGRTGRPLVQKALDAGHTIRALVRNPQHVTTRHARLFLVEGSSLDAAKVDETITGSDGVISVLGQGKDSPADLQTRSTQLIINAMKQHGLRRLVSLTGAGVRDAAHDKPGFIDKAIVFIMKNVAGSGPRNALFDGIAHADLIRQTDLDWTIVRGPMLTDDSAKGNYQVGHVGTVPGIKLTRADLADFMLKEFEQSRYHRQMPFVTNG